MFLFYQVATANIELIDCGVFYHIFSRYFLLFCDAVTSKTCVKYTKLKNVFVIV